MEEIFLELYKELEALLKEKYKGQAARSGVVMQFIRSVEGRPYREQLNTCREMRNILAHSPEIAGEPPLIPSEGAVQFMRELIAYLREPTLVLAYATPLERLLTAELDSPIYPVMELMQKEGFSHIPVLKERRVFGMFSASIFFSFVLAGKKDMQLEKISDIKDYLPIDRHVGETFVFVSRTATVGEARELFDRKGGPRHRRLAALLITKNGCADEPLLGMATPWDVILEEERR